MKLVGSLPCSQEPASGTYPEPDEFSPHLLTPFPEEPDHPFSVA